MNNKGFSIIEMMVSMGIFMVVSAGIYTVFNVGNSIYFRDVVLNDVREQTNSAIDRLARELRESESTVITNINSDEDEVRIDTPDRKGIRYYVRNRMLYKEYPAGTVKLIARNIQRMRCNRNGSKVTVSVQSDKAVRGKNHVFSLTQNVRLRNE